MSSTPRNAKASVKTQGSRQTVSSELTPRELHPNCRSDRAALIACGGLITARAVTGREYHYHLCGLWRSRELPGILSRYFPLTTFHRYCFSAGRGVPLTRLCSSQSQRECIWRMSILLSRSYPGFVTQKKTG